VIGLDTNVLVRYIVQDEPAQCRQAARLIESRCTKESPGQVCLIVLCELVWVLDRGYGFSRADVGAVLRRLLTVAKLCVERADVARQALRSFETGNADFADCLIGVTNRANQAEVTYTFDRKTCNGDLFQLVPR
jgi:predicted nucleic-acid-binding protein